MALGRDDPMNSGPEQIVRVSQVGRVAIVHMEDREGGNTIHPDLANGVRRALATIDDDEQVRSVVVTGLPSVFCAGATRGALLGTGDGLPLEEYEPFARAFLHCTLPVVTAMSGHSIGGGLVFGLYADVPVLSERSVYAANFLQYGMAPYVGATHIIPSRLGETLGAELLFTAHGYRGWQLRERGASVTIVPHEKVRPTALRLAERIAESPRASLVLLKQQLAARMLAATDVAMQDELEPHLAARALDVVPELAVLRYGPPTPVGDRSDSRWPRR